MRDVVGPKFAVVRSVRDAEARGLNLPLRE